MDDSEISQRLNNLEHRIAFLFDEFGLEDKFLSYQAQLVAQIGMDDVIVLLRMGKKIDAIKLYRMKTGTGLKEAKDAVERLEGM